MPKVILITGYFPKYDKYGFPTGEKEFLTSHGVCETTGKNIIVSQDHPKNLGGRFDTQIGEWVLD